MTDEEQQQLYDDAMAEIESGDAYVISDLYSGGYHVNLLRENFSSMDQAVKAIAADMRKNDFYPGVYFVNDHGNVDALALRIGKRRVTYKIVASWV